MYIYVFSFLVFSSSKNMKKNMKKRKKKMVHNWLGYCPTVSQYNGRLYRDIAVMGVQWLEKIVLQHGAMGCMVSVSQYTKCVVTVAGVWLGGSCVTIEKLYCDKRIDGWESMSQYTYCIVT